MGPTFGKPVGIHLPASVIFSRNIHSTFEQDILPFLYQGCFR